MTLAARKRMLSRDSHGVGIQSDSVIHALQKPFLRCAEDAIQTAVAEFDVPLFAIPGRGGPPIARSSPGPGGGEDFACFA